MTNQREICSKFKVEYVPCYKSDKLGIAIESIGKQPIHGLRHKAENGTCGWYIWCGEALLNDPDFFKPLHVSHVNQYLPQVLPYLALPPGHRFLLADGYEDVWQDRKLLGI
ncbi:hypothetical protein N473_08615 [Pseudoalteromonas luteoviolacea CPMOR-1]|uniref:Imm33-like domain-containing protein n=1 Tax=Pseudoalteromonas luteoviolacea CPMOR-1 TaxID=1365248 RepID=A0A167MHZ0_9GAMM|nr:hypothetical protein [Pseudoalteromonas luteoviolacea]KZN66443.1 hypothetical protein N473_08615 [Pseudoalteromonas luteoviolacea CPMOR-1]